MMKFGFSVVGIALLIGVSPVAGAGKQWLVTDASRTDAIVKVSYERNEFQRSRPEQGQADGLAAKMCAAWGYAGAVQFGSEETICLSRRGFGNCGRRRITLPYQCAGTPSEAE